MWRQAVLLLILSNRACLLCVLTFRIAAKQKRGRKLLFFDADDTMDSAALHSVLTDPRCSDADLTIFGLTFDYYRAGRCYRRDPLFFEHDGILKTGDWHREFQQLYLKNSLSPLWNKVFCREIIQTHHLELNTELFLYEDLEFVLRYLAHCNTIFNVPQAIYHYRQAEDEGNAKRRLARIDCLRTFVDVIADAMHGLQDVAADQKEAILVQLYQVLAREKISGADLKQIRRICDDYAGWYRARGCRSCSNRFHQQLMGRKAAALMITDKTVALRHKIAVWAKAHHLYKRK